VYRNQTDSLETGSSEPVEHVLFVHAHPDDETIATGATIAMLIDRGSVVTVLTCTRGELGEVIPADIKGLEGTAQLAAHRSSELEAAMQILGVTDHRFLGDSNARWGGRAPGRYTDSGMRWGASGAEATETFPSDSLCAARLEDVAADVAAVMAATRPTAVISYDSNGGYGHPDHVRAHEATRRAAEVMNVPFFSIDNHGEVVVNGAEAVARKTAALTAYRSQVVVDGENFALSSGPARPILAVERFARARDAPERRAEWKDQSLAVRCLAGLLALVIGAAIGGITTVEHQFTVMAGGRALPAGIVITLVIAAALFMGARIVFDCRLVSGLCALGMIGVTGLLSVASGGGGILVPTNPAGYLLTYGTAAIAVVVLVWPASGPFRRDKIKTIAELKGPPAS